ncbi:FAD/NAD(P)-binding domain-containing protein [Mycena capillaripes]|nr:FAD/NAD(P)-binding domain-containing protein [Mycena capillaripes]
MSNHPKNIIIVGGSPSGGVAVLRGLLPKLPSAQITLINPLPYALALPTLPRMTVSESNDLLSTVLILYDKLFTKATSNATFVEGIVVAIQPDEQGGLGVVLLADGTQLPYDVLVLAPGSVWEGPLDFPWKSEAVKAFVNSSRTGFKKAQKIVLAGGGAVGVEYAGEIKDIWPEKEVTIIHGGNSIMNATYPARFREGLERGLRARGVNIILEDYVDGIPPPGPVTIRTRKGQEIDADLVISTRGPRPRTEFIAQLLGPETLDERGQIKVRQTMQLLAHPNIFAVGDAINTVEQKQVNKAQAHAAIAAANVIAYLSPSGGKMKEYIGAPELIVITNGRNGGMAYFGVLWGLTFGNWVARLMKSRSLLLWMTRSFMGY